MSARTDDPRFHSELKAVRPIKFTWKIDQLKTFLQLYARSFEMIDQIFCKFPGASHERLRRDTWILRFISISDRPYISFKRLSERSNTIVVCAEVLLMNSESVNVFNHKSPITAVAPNGEITISIGGTWPEFTQKVTDGHFTVHCTLEQKIWDTFDNYSDSPSADEDQVQHESLVTDFKNLLESGVNSDVTFKLSNGNLLQAHKAILSARSPVFQRMFITGMKEAKDNIVEIDDMGEESMKALLMYIYTGKIEFQEMTAEIIKEMVNASDKYQLVKLKELCDEHLLDCCDAKNAFDLLELSRLHDLKVAEDLICSFIEMNIGRILKPGAAGEGK